MKRFVLILCLMLSATCLAESSDAGDFLSNLGRTWDSFVAMTEDAADSVSAWADESGVTDWAQGVLNEIGAWAEESGLTEWANAALSDVQTWAKDIGFTEWAENVSAETRKLIDKNRPAVEAWLTQAGEDVKRAWNTLVDADQHTAEEVEAALETVVESLEEAQSPIVGRWRHDDTLLIIGEDGTGSLVHVPEDIGVPLSWEAADDGWIVCMGGPDEVCRISHDAATDTIILTEDGGATEYAREQ